MNNNEKYFEEKGILFCNTLFQKDGINEEEDLSLDNTDPVKSFYIISSIIGANVSGIKGWSTIRVTGIGSITIEIPFTELMKIFKNFHYGKINQ